MFAIRTGALSIATALALLTGGCIVEIEHSIIDKPAATDERLPGAWALEADGGAQVLVLHARDGEREQLEATFIIAPKDEPPAISRAFVKFTSIGGRPYFEVQWRTGEWLPLDPPVRASFGTYELTGTPGAEILKLCLADTESFEAPIENGTLKGFSGKGESYERRVVLASDGPSLRAYLAKNHFKCSVSATFRRLSGPEQSR